MCVYVFFSLSKETNQVNNTLPHRIHCVDDRILISIQFIFSSNFFFLSTIYVNVVSHKWLSIMHYSGYLLYYSLGGPAHE